MKTRLLKLFASCSFTLLSSVVFSQAPTISYTPNAYILPLNTAVNPAITPASTNVTGSYGATATFSTANRNVSVVTYDPVSGDFYAVDYVNGYLDKITPAGVLTTWDTNPINNNAGASVIVDGLGNIYVSDISQRSVFEFSGTATNTVIRTITGFNTPSGLAVDAANNVYVADGNGNVYKIPAGVANSKSVFLNGFTTPYGIAITASGDMYVSQDGAAKNIIKIANAIGGSTAKTTFATGFVTNPLNLTFDTFGDIFVPDGTNIKMVSPTGTITTALAGLTTPGQVDFDPSGNLYIADMNRQIKESLVSYYTISAALPAGLSFSTTTGVISGTPTVAAGPTVYTVTAHNTTGTATATITITCKVVAPSITYTTPDTYIVGTPVTLTPTNTGSPITSASVLPTLPAGLTISATGVISGTPTTVTAAANYVVTASNAGGAGTFTVNITVNPKAPVITYTTPDVYTTGVAITALNPNTSGGGAVASYAVSPALPAGLSIDPVTGIISGTPTGTAAAANYVVTATNVTGTGTFAINITVNPPKPIISYTTPDVYTTGVAITPLNPTNSGGTPTSYSGALPPGLSINAGTGVISGTPTTISAATNYTITATNAGGSGTFVINITCNPPAPAITYTTPDVYTAGVPVTLNPTNTGGPITSATTAPALPAGLSISATGVISGTPTGASPATDYLVTATNAGGSGTFTVNITVNIPPAPALVYTNPAPITYGSAIPTLTPTNSGGAPTSCSISPTGTGLAVSATGVITGTPNAAGTTVYTITATNGGGTTTSTVTITVNTKALTITGMTANNKVYDGTTTATFTGGTLAGVVPGDVVTLNASGTFGAPAPNIGTNIPVTSTSTLGGAQAANYTLTQPAGLKANITAKALTISGLVTNSKVYDGTNTQFYTGGTLVGVVSPDVVTLNASGTFATKNVGTNIAVTSTSTIGGAGAGNYILTQPANTTANITAKNLTITGLTANNKVYDGTTTASFSGGTLVGVVSPDVVNFTTTGNFATANVGNNIAVASTSTLGGAGAGNYTLTQVTGLTANITPAPLTITAVSQTRDVGINTTLTVTYAGFVNGETSANLTTLPTITTTATAASPPSPPTYPITASGAVDNNYTITYVAGTLTITASGTHTYTWDWTGAVSTAWENPKNWSIGGVQQTTNYPGSATTKDVVQVGVAVNFTAATSPVVNSTVKVTSVLFGSDNGSNQIGVTVTGAANSLTTIGDITAQADNAILGNSLTISLSGTGTINVTNLNVINNQNAVSFETTGITSSVAALNVSGNISLTTNAGFIAFINSRFLLTGGTTTVAGTLTSNNTALFGTTNSTFSIVPATTATLNLSNTNALNLDNNTSTLDFDHAGSLVNYTGANSTVYTSSAPNASAGATYRNLTISGTGTALPATGTLTVDGNLITSAATNFGTNAPVVNVAGNWTNSANINQGGSNITVSTTLTNTTGTITGGAGFLTAGSITLNGGTLAAAAGTVTAGNYLNNGGAFNCGSGSVIFKGSYTNNNPGTFTASTGTVFFSGAGQALQDNSTPGTVFNNVTFNGTGNTSITASTGTSGNFAVSTTGTLTMVGSAKLTAGSGSANIGYLTLLSGASSTATVGIIPATSSIVGPVNVQRYISGGNISYRGYRLLTSPVNISSNTIGGGNLSLNYLNTDASFGGVTYHGAFTEGPGTGFTLDFTANPSIYLYDESRNTDNRSFTGGKNVGVVAINAPNTVNLLSGGVFTNNVSIPVGNSYLLYYGGDNTSTSVPPTRIPENTSITAKGYLNQGDVTVKFWKAPQTTSIPYDVTIDDRTGLPIPIFGINQVGNPYASTISLDSVYFDNKAAISSILWELKEPGQVYVAYNASSHTASTTGSGAGAYVVSGQGFLIAALSTGKTFTLHERDKVNKQLIAGGSPPLVLSLPVGPTLASNFDTPAGASLAAQLPSAAIPVQTPGSLLKGLHLQLTKDSVNYTQTGIYFSSNWTDTYNSNDDAVDLDGAASKVFLSSYSTDGKRLSINQLGDYTKGKRVKLYAGVTSTGSYTISLADITNIDTNLYRVYLVDNKMNDSLDMVHYKSYAFNINNSDTTTYGANRFVLVIERPALPPYQLINFAGQKVNNGVQLNWKTMNEGDYTGFVLQKLLSDNSYSPLYTTQSTGVGLYSYVDQYPVIGSNTYRLQQTDINNTITYSAPVTINYNNKTPNGSLIIYPNPSRSIIHITLVTNSASVPNYIVDIYNTSGTVVSHKIINTNTWAQDISSYKLGVYIIEIKTNNGYLVGKSKFVKIN